MDEHQDQDQEMAVMVASIVPLSISITSFADRGFLVPVQSNQTGTGPGPGPGAGGLMDTTSKFSKKKKFPSLGRRLL